MIAVTPVRLEEEVPEGLPPGWCNLEVTTTAGSSEAECLLADEDGEAVAVGVSCVEVLGAPVLETAFPRPTAWSDAVALVGGAMRRAPAR